MLAGHTVKLNANVTDTNYYPANYPIDITATAGEVSGGIFTAPQQGGIATVTAVYDNLFAQQDILLSLGELRSFAVSTSGVAATAVVEPPPSRHRAVPLPPRIPSGQG